MRPRLLKSQNGFTYVAAIILVVIMGIMLAQGGRYWKMRMQREKEVELIFRGTQIRDAMRRWYNLAPGLNSVAQPGQSNPLSLVIKPNVRALTRLDDLLEDPYSPGKVRYLRKLYPDPMTGKEWTLIKDASQRVIGVASSSEEAPIKQANFPFDLDPADFENKKKYSEWQFICIHYPRPGTTGQITGLGGSGTPGTPAGGGGTAAPVGTGGSPGTPAGTGESGTGR